MIKSQMTDKQDFMNLYVFQTKLKTLKLLRVKPGYLDYVLGLNTYKTQIASQCREKNQIVVEACRPIFHQPIP